MANSRRNECQPQRLAAYKPRADDTALHIRVGYVIKARGEKRYLNLQVTP